MILPFSMLISKSYRQLSCRRRSHVKHLASWLIGKGLFVFCMVRRTRRPMLSNVFAGAGSPVIILASLWSTKKFQVLIGQVPLQMSRKILGSASIKRINLRQSKCAMFSSLQSCFTYCKSFIVVARLCKRCTACSPSLLGWRAPSRCGVTVCLESPSLWDWLSRICLCRSSLHDFFFSAISDTFPFVPTSRRCFHDYYRISLILRSKIQVKGCRIFAWWRGEMADRSHLFSVGF